MSRSFTKSIANAAEIAMGYDVVLTITVDGRDREILLEVLHSGKIFSQGEDFYASETAARAVADDIVTADMRRRASQPNACKPCKGLGVLSLVDGRFRVCGLCSGAGVLVDDEPVVTNVTSADQAAAGYLVELVSDEDGVMVRITGAEVDEIPGYASETAAIAAAADFINKRLSQPAAEVPAITMVDGVPASIIVERDRYAGAGLLVCRIDFTPVLDGYQLIDASTIIGARGTPINGTRRDNQTLESMFRHARADWANKATSAGWVYKWLNGYMIWVAPQPAPAAPVPAAEPVNMDKWYAAAAEVANQVAPLGIEVEIVAPADEPVVTSESGSMIDRLARALANTTPTPEGAELMSWIDAAGGDAGAEVLESAEVDADRFGADPPMSELDRGYYNMREDNLAAERRAESEHQEYLAELDSHAGCQHGLGVCNVAERASADADAEEWYAANAPACEVCGASVAEWNRDGSKDTLCRNCDELIPAHQIIPIFTQAWREVADQLGAGADHSLIYDRTLDYMAGRITLESIQPAAPAPRLDPEVSIADYADVEIVCGYCMGAPAGSTYCDCNQDSGEAEPAEAPEPTYACWLCKDTGQKIVAGAILGSGTFYAQYGTCDHITASQAAADCATLMQLDEQPAPAACCDLAQAEYQCSECGMRVCLWHSFPYHMRDYCQTCRDKIGRRNSAAAPLDKPESTLAHARRVLAQHGIEVQADNESGEIVLSGLCIKDVELIVHIIDQAPAPATSSDPVQLARFISEG